MFLLFFICWVIFNQSFTLEIALFGIAISALVYLFICKFMDYSIKKDLFIMKKLPLIVAYIFVLVWEVIKANFSLWVNFYIRKSLKEPVLVTFKTRLQSRIARTLLANSITLTPGTITTTMEGNVLTVHCVDKSLAKGLNDSVFERRLLKLEEGFNR